MATAIRLLDEMIDELQLIVDQSNNPPTNDITQDSKTTDTKTDVSKPTEKKEKPQKTATNAKKGADSSSEGPITINSIDLRVGIIKSVRKHDTADKLYCEEIDVGEESLRQIASGLVKHHTLEEMQDRAVIVVCNLKPRNLVGFKSNGMVLCGVKTLENGEEKVELLTPPEGSKPGDRIIGQSLPIQTPLGANQCDKKKAFELIAPDLKLINGIAMWKDILLVNETTGGMITSASIQDGLIR